MDRPEDGLGTDAFDHWLDKDTAQGKGIIDKGAPHAPLLTEEEIVSGQVLELKSGCILAGVLRRQDQHQTVGGNDLLLQILIGDTALDYRQVQPAVQQSLLEIGAVGDGGFDL